LIEILNERPNKYKLNPYKERKKMIPICYKIINSYGEFKKLYNFILNITNKTGTNSIQEVFQENN